MATDSITHTPDQLLAEIRTHGVLIVKGLEALQDLKTLLARATRELGVRIEWAPESEPLLTDWLGGAAIGALHGAVAGAAIGLLLGALVDDAEQGMALGALLGASGGAFHGLAKIQKGWRVRAGHDHLGVHWAHVEVIG